ncbi:sulfotransferase family protein [Crateriforma conspicua]|uniref:Stf0 sulfotransferase n=1 Tax=Crateriforma conspicua TaxID=2527996 RepID=A0A5C5XVH8_9PLAN|nr:hypothetical protein [Crateriforma conspicua]TWT65602.1 Stf0 sulfotransferase [Crateriforma conspicua]
MASPRTGSTLLCESLGEHTDGWNAGEILNDRFRNSIVEAFGVGESIRRCSVFKVFPWDAEKAEFEKLMQRCPLRVFLYRRDRAAQIGSWQRACRTGQWHAEDSGVPAEFPSNAPEIIEMADQQFRPLADMEIRYETMVSQWADTMKRIQVAAGWSIEPLPMARRKLER